MNEIQEFETRKPQLEALLAEFEALGQPRSDYVLAHFVIGQHDRPARQRQQALLELREMLFTLADTADDIRLLELDIEELTASFEAKNNNFQKRRTELEIGRKQRQVTALRLQMAGRLRECEFLYELLKKLPPTTRENFEQQEADYWQARLTRQYFLGQRDHGGNLNAALEMLTKPGENKPALDINFSQLVPLLNLSPEAIRRLVQSAE